MAKHVGHYNRNNKHRYKPYSRGTLSRRTNKVNATSKNRVVRNIKVKHPKSHSNKTLSKKNHNTTEAIHDEIVRRYHTLYIGPKGKVSNRTKKGCWKIDDQGDFVVTADEGQQGTSNPSVVICNGTVSQYINDSGLIYGPNQQAAVGWINCNPYQKNSGGGLYAAGTKPEDDRICVDVIEQKFEIGNFGTTSAHVEMYVVLPKTTTSLDPITYWDECLESEALGYGPMVQQTNNANYAAGYGNRKFLDLRPDALPSWKKMWKIVHKENFDLAPGANVVDTIKMEFGGKIIERKYMQEQAGQFVKGVTPTIFFIARGVVVVDKQEYGSVSALPSRVTTSSVKIGGVYTRKCVFHAPPANRTQTEFVNPRLMTGATLADQKFANVVDVIASVAQAL